MTGQILWITESAPVVLPELPDGWQITCANNNDAQQWQQPPELLVVDLPQSQQVQDLQHRFSHCIRVLAVPDCQDELLLPFIQQYHLFCQQPLPDESFSRLVTIASALSALGLQATSRAQLLACSHLPLVPPLVQQLQQLLLDPDVRVDKLADLIEQDPVLSARLLQLANSAYMGFNHETHSIQMAISRLGLSLLYGVVLALSVADNAEGKDLLAGVRLAGHCRLVGQWLNLDQAATEQMVLCALFYQLGHTLLSTAAGDVSALTPAQAGAFMLTLWGFAAPAAKVLLAQQDLQLCLDQPAALGLYLARHHQPLGAPEPALEQVLIRLGIRQQWPAS